MFVFFFFFKQKSAYEISARDWSSDVCSSDLGHPFQPQVLQQLFQFLSHLPMAPPAESTRGSRAAGSSAPAGPDRRDRNGRLPPPRPAVVRGDPRARTAAVGVAPV